MAWDFDPIETIVICAAAILSLLTAALPLSF